MRLTKEAITELERNPFVVRWASDRITYSREFKHHFMREYNAGKKSTEIFRAAGFDPRMIGSKRIERARCALEKRVRRRNVGIGRYQKRSEKRIKRNEKAELGQFDCVLRPVLSFLFVLFYFEHVAPCHHVLILPL